MHHLKLFGTLLTLVVVLTSVTPIKEASDRSSNDIEDPATDPGQLSPNQEKGDVLQGSGSQQEIQHSVQNCTNGTDSCETDVHRPLGQVLSEMLHDNRGTLTRTFYVLIGVTIIVVVYFVLRAVR